MKVWKQKLAAAVLAGMLLGAGCTEELDPRPPSAELTEEELLEIQETAAAAEEIANKADAAAERARSIGADEATAEIVQRAQEKAETAEAKVNSASGQNVKKPSVHLLPLKMLLNKLKMLWQRLNKNLLLTKRS